MKRPGIFGIIDDADILDKVYTLDGTEDDEGLDDLDKADLPVSETSAEDKEAIKKAKAAHRRYLASPKALKDNHGKRVFVYFNLHRKIWSIKDPKTGKVVAHARSVAISDPVFKVSEAGRQRVIAEKKKNVHAGAVGVLDANRSNFSTEGRPRVTYNPYKIGNFYEVETEKPTHHGKEALFTVMDLTDEKGKPARKPQMHVLEPTGKKEDLVAKSELPGIFATLKKNEILSKAIHELQPGKMIQEVRNGDTFDASGNLIKPYDRGEGVGRYTGSNPVSIQHDAHKHNYTQYDYNHLIPENVRNEHPNLNMVLTYHPTASTSNRPKYGSYSVDLILKNPEGTKNIGSVYGLHDKEQKRFYIHADPMISSFRNKGLGKAMYEAAMAHAYHVLKAPTLGWSPTQTEDAFRVHMSLARKHGLKYEPYSTVEAYRSGGPAYISHEGYKIPTPTTLPKSKQVQKSESMAKSDEVFIPDTIHRMAPSGSKFAEKGKLIVDPIGGHTVIATDAGGREHKFNVTPETAEALKISPNIPTRIAPNKQTARRKGLPIPTGQRAMDILEQRSSNRPEPTKIPRLSSVSSTPSEQVEPSNKSKPSLSIVKADPNLHIDRKKNG